MNKIQEIKSRCECGQRYSIFVYNDGTTERTMPIHCQGCHRETYEHIIMLCDNCYVMADVRGIGYVERLQLDGQDVGEPVLQRDVLHTDKRGSGDPED